METALFYDYENLTDKYCPNCGSEMVLNGSTIASVTIDRGKIKFLTPVGDSLPLEWICEECIAEDKSFESLLEKDLKKYNDYINRVEIVYEDGTPVQAILHILISTGTGTKGPYAFHPPDEAYGDMLENKNYKVSFKGRMYYYPNECKGCATKECVICDKLEVGAKYIVGEKKIDLPSYSSYQQVFELLRTNV